MKIKNKTHPNMDDEHVSVTRMDKSNNSNLSSKNLVLLKDLPLKIRMKEARKPIYLVRYE